MRCPCSVYVRLVLNLYIFICVIGYCSVIAALCLLSLGNGQQSHRLALFSLSAWSKAVGSFRPLLVERSYPYVAMTRSMTVSPCSRCTKHTYWWLLSAATV